MNAKSATLSEAIEDARRALATFADAAFHPNKREPLREQARRLVSALEAHASENQYREILLRYRDDLLAALQRCERAVEAARTARAEREQLEKLLAEAGRHVRLAYIYPWRDITRRADDVVAILRRSGGEEAVRLAQEIASLASSLKARAILRQRRSWQRG